MTTMTAAIGHMMLRELTSLLKEIEAYPNDADVWKVPAGITNSAGTLTLHLAGNLQHFVGAGLGKTGYVRDRPREFAARDLPRAELYREIGAAMKAVELTFARLTDADCGGDFPLPLGPVTVNTGDGLIHLAAHLAYHVGQVDYHRRLITGSTHVVSVVAPGRLLSAREPT